MTRPNEMGTGAVWSNPDVTIVHFGSPPATLVGQDGKPLGKES